MPDRLQTYPIEFKGGLIDNLSPLQHGIAAPGSARVLSNFEPSIDGGYRRIEGFTKFNSNAVTGTGALLGVVQHRGQVVVARAQSSGDPHLYLVASGSGSHTDLSTSIELGTNATSVRFVNYNFDGDEDLIIVDGKGYPLLLKGTTAGNLSKLTSSNGTSDIDGAEHVAIFKNHVMIGNGDKLVFSAPYEDDDFSPANGAGTIRVGGTITSLISFRDQLVIFCENKIFRLVGSSAADFKLSPIASDIGCVEGDTVQEVAGDVVFLAQDGLRTISGTEKVGDFNLLSVSKVIQGKIEDFVQSHTSFSSVTIGSKTQYRIFGFSNSITTQSAKGFIGTQILGESGVQFNWAETSGIQAKVSHSSLRQGIELIIFGHTDGYIYKMESGNDFDGTDIIANFSTPYFPISDPRLRKTIYRAIIYTDPQGSLNVDFNLKFDLSETGIVEPNTINIANTAGTTGTFLYGDSNSTYGTAKYSGATLKSVFTQQTKGSGYIVSLQFNSESSNPPYSFDAVSLEYGQYGRR